MVQGQYLTISKHSIYAVIPAEHEIRICMATKGYLCMLNQAIYPVQTLEWCVYALYISDRERFNKHCLADFKIWHANLTVSLDGRLWAISSLVTEKIQIQC